MLLLQKWKLYSNTIVVRNGPKHTKIDFAMVSYSSCLFKLWVTRKTISVIAAAIWWYCLCDIFGAFVSFVVNFAHKRCFCVVTYMGNIQAKHTTVNFNLFMLRTLRVNQNLSLHKQTGSQLFPPSHFNAWSINLTLTSTLKTDSVIKHTNSCRV